MEQSTGPRPDLSTAGSGEISIFDTIGERPVYYSQKAINIFSVLFSVLFGSVLLAMNLNQKPETKKAMRWVVAFGVLYTAASMTLLELLSSSSILTLVFNMGGGYVLSRLLWNKYLGTEVLYTKRSVIKPVVIGIGIVALFAAALLFVGFSGAEP